LVSHSGTPLLSRHAIVYFGNDWFAENRTSSHHVALRLARHAPLLYVDTPGSRAPRASGRDLRKLVRKLVEAAALPREIGPRMWHMTMPQIPFRRLPLVDRANRAAGAFLLRRAIRHLGFKEILSWFLVPHPAHLAGALGERATIYYCIDDYAAFPGADSASISRLDGHLTRAAALVFVSARRLWEEKLPARPDAILSPHGVDADHFHRASDPATTPPPEAAALRRPVIGFFGNIGAWVDTGLVAELARRRPEWTFLLVGHPASDVSALEGLANVVLAGARPYAELPRWAAVFDVALIPYKLTRQVVNASPLKLREYLATGKPVVSVSTPEIGQFSSVIRIAGTPGEFVAAIEAALADGPGTGMEERLAAVASMSWDARGEEIAARVERFLEGRIG
jgi:glycosyltransferase involved in cell wall biosynthesis